MADKSCSLLRKVSCTRGTPYVCSGRKCQRMGMADRSCGLRRKVSRGSGTPHVCSGCKCRRTGIVDSTVGANERSAECRGHHCLTFMCQNTRAQGGELVGANGKCAEGCGRRGAERHWRSYFINILDV